MTHTCVPTHTVTQTWATIFLRSIYHRGNATYAGMYDKFILCSSFIMINTAWARKSLLFMLQDCAVFFKPIASPMQESRVAQETTMKTQLWLKQKGITSTINYIQTINIASLQRTSSSPDGDHGLIPTLLWCFAHVELTDFLQRIALYWGTRWLFWSERTTDKKKGFFSASVPT